jgi:cytochrome c-type biogenesis protein CcmE
MTRRQRRLILIGSSLGVLATAVALVPGSPRDSIVFFNSPTDIAANKTAPGTRVRLGGMVKMGSLERDDNLQIRFEVTDGEGHVEPGGLFKADTVLAKHDENDMPREVFETLKKRGHWQESAAPFRPGAR